MARQSVAIVISDGVDATGVAGALDVLREANSRLGPARGYDVLIIAEQVRPLRASNGLAMLADMDFQEAARRFDTVIVAGGSTLSERVGYEATARWLSRGGGQAGRYGAMCSGVFALAYAGLLDGRKATSRLCDVSKLTDLCPTARIYADLDYVRDGPLMTSGGNVAGLDLAFGLLSDDHGRAIAAGCTRRLASAGDQRDHGDRDRVAPAEATGSSISRIQSHVRSHLNETLSVERLAEIAGTSARSLARLFTAELGITPHEFVQTARLDRARTALEHTDLPLKVVAHESGFATAEQMRVVFQRRLGMSPGMYRKIDRNLASLNSALTKSG